MHENSEDAKGPLLAGQEGLEREIAGPAPGCRLEFDEHEMRCRALAGATHFRWDEFDGPFVLRDDGSVTFNIKAEHKKRHSWFTRQGFKATRKRYDADVRLMPEKYGGGERLLEALNRQLASRTPAI